MSTEYDSKYDQDDQDDEEVEEDEKKCHEDEYYKKYNKDLALRKDEDMTIFYARWDRTVKEHFERQFKMDKITDKIFITSYETSLKIDVMKEYEIKTIIYISEQRKLNNVLTQYKENNIDHHYFECEDRGSENIHKFFSKVVNIIESKKNSEGNILVHCMAGISRSPTLVMAWLIHQGMTFKEAWNYIKQKRAIVGPNDGFEKQLKEWQGNISKK